MFLRRQDSLHRASTSITDPQTRHKEIDIIILKPSHEAGLGFVVGDTKAEVDRRFPGDRVDDDQFGMSWILVFSGQVESADQATFELVHAVPCDFRVLYEIGCQ